MAVHQGRIVLVHCGQGWTGPLGPRSRRIDCMIAKVVVLVKISMSAPPSTPVYFATTRGGRVLGDGVEVGSDRCPYVLAVVLENRSRVDRGQRLA